MTICHKQYRSVKQESLKLISCQTVQICQTGKFKVDYLSQTVQICQTGKFKVDHLSQTVQICQTGKFKTEYLSNSTDLSNMNV